MATTTTTTTTVPDDASGMSRAFCPRCENFLYETEASDQTCVAWWCRQCHEEYPRTHPRGQCVLSEIVAHPTLPSQERLGIVPSLLVHDPTLPRVRDIPCPRPECATNRAKDPEPCVTIVHLYDPDQLKYVYICETCKQSFDVVKP